MKKSYLVLLPIFLLVACSPPHAAPPSNPLLPGAAAAPAPEAFLPQSLPHTKLPPSKFYCPNVDFHKWQTWQDVGRAMKKAPLCFMGQSWQHEVDPALQACTVAVAHDVQYLVVYAELHDVDIYNDIKQNGVPAFNNGDVFEMFLRSDRAQAYLEHHITPDNAYFQLTWPTAETHADGKHPNWSTEFISKVGVVSQVLAQPDQKLWRILVLIPLDELSQNFDLAKDSVWHFSFSRYDYTHGAKWPVFSSASPHTTLNFHQQEAWGRLELLDNR